MIGKHLKLVADVRLLDIKVFGAFPLMISAETIKTPSFGVRSIQKNLSLRMLGDT